MRLLFKLFAIFLFCCSGSELLAQNIVDASHETDAQDQISVTFDAGTFTLNTGDYAVTQNGTPIGIASIVQISPTEIVILLSIPLMIEPDPVVVSYLPNGSNTISQNNRVLTCDDFKWQATNTPTPPCAPVNPITVMTFAVKPGARNSSNFDLTLLLAHIRWFDPGNNSSDLPAYESDASGNSVVIATNFISFDASLNGFKYPATDDECSYISRWEIGGIGPPCSIIDPNQIITYASHNKDDEGNGVLDLEPTILNSDLVCFNDEVDMSFSDVSTLNCINDPDQPNIENRWVRVTYGDASRPNSDRIPNVYIGGVQVTDATGQLISGAYIPTNAGGSGALGTGDIIGVVSFSKPSNLNLPAGSLDQITTIMTPGETRDVGDRFYVTIEYWNVCNPYTVGNPLNNQVSTQDFVEIIDIPPLPSNVDDLVCKGDDLTSINFEISDTGSSSAVNWYDDDPNMGGALIANPNGTNENLFPATSYPGGIDANVPGTYTLWASYVIGATNSCESEPVEITLEIRPELLQPGIILPTNAVCKDAQDVTFGLFDPAGIDVKYIWSVSGSGISIDGSNEGNSIKVDFNVPGTFTSTSREISVVREYDNGPACTSTEQSFDIPISGGPKASVTGGGAVCAGNPASDITWTFDSDFATDFDFSIEVYEGTSPAVLASTITETGYTSDSYTIMDPTPTVDTEYRLVSLTDAAGCPVTLSESAFVTIGGTPPIVDDITVGLPVCDNGAATVASAISIDLAENSVRSYQIKYTIEGGAELSKTLASDANGIITLSPDYVNELSSTPGSYDYEILSITDVATTCNVDVNEVRTVTINPLPDSPANPVDVAVCQGDIGTAMIQVDDPGGDLTIDWYDADLPGGTVLISDDNMITPGAAGTYYAEVRNTLTGCTSGERVGVTIFEDIPPSMADAGTAPPPFCETAITLSAAMPASGRGTWSAPGILYAEHFSDLPAGTMPDGTTEDNDLYGWNVTVDPNAMTPPDDYFEVRGEQFSGRDLNEEAVWYTKTIDITAVTDIDVSLNVEEDGDLEAAGTSRDYLGMYYQIDGGIETLVGTELAGNFEQDTIKGSFSTGGGSTLTILIRVKTNSNDEIISFDDLEVKSSGTTIDFDDLNDPGTAISGLPVGITPLTWTVTSALGVCAPTDQTINIERLPPPANTDPMPEICEDVAGDAEALVDLNDYKDDIVGAAVSADRTVSWFEDEERNVPIADPTAFLVNNTTEKTVYTIVENNTSSCTSMGMITFTVVGLPEANDQEVELCEDVLDDGIVDDVDLGIYVADIIAPADAADRTVTWYEDLGLSTTVPAPGDVDGVTNGATFYAMVDNAAAGCYDVAELKFTVNPKPKNNPIQLGGLTPAAITFCKNASDPVFFQVSGSLNINSTYEWTVPATGEFVLEAGATLDNFFLPLTFPVSVPPPGLPITLVETSEDGCVGNVNTINIIVVDIPEKPVINGNPDACIGEENVAFSIDSPNPGAKYVWDVPGSMGFIVSGQNTDQIEVNIGNNLGPYQIKVTEVSSNDCTSPEADPFDVEVHDIPVMTSANNATICSGQSVSDIINFTADDPSATFSWTVISKSASIDGTAFGDTGTGNITDILTNTSTSVGDVTYEVTPQGPAPGNCNGNGQFVFVSVEPVPDLSANSTSPICSGQEINIEVQNTVTPTNRSDLSFRVEVISSNPGATGGSAFMDKTDLLYPTTLTGDLTNSSLTPIDVTFRLYPELNGCATGAFEEVVVVVNPLPLVTNLSKTACSDVIINKVKTLDLTVLNSEINGDAGVTISWFRDPFLNSPIITPTSYTVFDNIPLYAEVDNGSCTNVAEVIYTINAKPQVSATVDSDYDGFGISCLNAVDGRIVTTVLDATGLLAFELLDKDKVSLGEVNGTGVFEGLGQGQYHVKVTDDNGCTGETILPALINAPFDLSGGFVFGTQNICEGEAPSKFEEISAPFGGTGNYTYQWQMSTDGVNYTDIVGANSFEYQHGAFITAGSYYFKRLVDTDNSCGPVESNGGVPVEVRVNSTPSADFVFIDNLGNEITQVCQGTPFFIEFRFTNGTQPFRFDYNDGVDFNVDVFGSDITRITYPDGITNDLTINLTKVKDAFGCGLGLNITKTLNVIQLESEFTVLNSPVCTGKMVDFEYFDASGVAYTWDFGDGQMETFIGSGAGTNTISHIYNSGNFNTAVDFPVRLTVDRGTCIGTKVKEVQVQPSVVANVIPTAIQICSGEEITFKNSSLGTDVNTWYYREKGTTQMLDQVTNTGDLVKTFFNNDPVKNPIIYEVVYEGKNNEGCVDSQVIEFSVYQNPGASIDYMSPIPEFVAGESQVSFINNSTIPDQSNFDYAWNFGDDADPETLDAFIPPVTVTYSSPGQKNISFYTYNLVADAVGLTCASEDLITINITRPPVSADFELDPQLGCAPLTVTVTENNSKGADTFFWTVVNQLNDTVYISTDVLPEFTISRPGEYNVYLQASYDDTGQEALSQPKKIVVHVVPIASFDVRPDLVYLPEPMRTFNFSRNADTYEWDFGDSSPLVTDFEPEYIYETEGIFTIQLTAFANYDDGVVCLDTVSVQLPVQEGGSTRIPNAFTPSLNGPSPDGRIQREVDNDIFLPIMKGVEEFQMLVFDRWGNLIFESNDQTVGWDGYDNNNNLLPAGVYVFKLTLRLSSGERTTRIGDITLIR